MRMFLELVVILLGRDLDVEDLKVSNNLCSWNIFLCDLLHWYMCGLFLLLDNTNDLL